MAYNSPYSSPYLTDEDRQRLLREAEAGTGGMDSQMSPNISAAPSSRDVPISGKGLIALEELKDRKIAGMKTILGAETPTLGLALAKTLAAGTSRYLGDKNTEERVSGLRKSLQAEANDIERVRLDEAELERETASGSTGSAKMREYAHFQQLGARVKVLKQQLLDDPSRAAELTPQLREAHRVYKNFGELILNPSYVNAGDRHEQTRGFDTGSDIDSYIDSILPKAVAATGEGEGDDVGVSAEPGTISGASGSSGGSGGIPIVLAPNETPKYKGEVRWAERMGEVRAMGAEDEETHRLALPKVKQTLANAETNYHVAINGIANIMDVLDKNKGWVAGVGGKVMQWVPGSAATDLESQLLSLRSKIMLSALADLKSSSETGGSGLGQLNQAEGDALRASWGALDSGAAPAVFRKQLEEVLLTAKDLRRVNTLFYNERYANDTFKQLPFEEDELFTSYLDRSGEVSKDAHEARGGGKATVTKYKIVNGELVPVEDE